MEQCQEICLNDPKNCRGYTHMPVGLNGHCYKFKELTGMRACETCSSGTSPQILDDSACTFNKEIKIGEESAKTVAECWKMCFETTGCLAFTYHNASSQYQNVCDLFSQQCSKAFPCEDCMSGQVNRLAAPVQCYEYGILDEETRNVWFQIDSEMHTFYWDEFYSYRQSLRWSGDGYYRMVRPAGEMLLEGDPVNDFGAPNACGSLNPGFLLKGSHPTAVGQEIDSVVYFNGVNFTSTITITKCPDDFYVYHLSGLGRLAFSRYCGDLLPYWEK